MNNYPSITAKVIADTKPTNGVRITSFEVEFPRFILAEVNTHRVIAKSASSSRAIPAAKHFDRIANDPFIPSPNIPLKAKKGMQAEELLSAEDYDAFALIWLRARNDALHAAQSISATVHKQHANRLLEPFMYQRDILTATEWDNFFRLRVSTEAQPEFHELAYKMREAYIASTPSEGLLERDMIAPQHSDTYHLPYICPVDDENILTTLDLDSIKKISAARCARVSYKSNQTGLRSNPQEDIRLADDLIRAGHMSPFDHAAVADCLSARDGQMFWLNPDLHRQFYGWIPYRVEVESITGYEGRRSSYAAITLGDLR